MLFCGISIGVISLIIVHICIFCHTGSPWRTKNGVSCTLEGIDEGLPEVLIREGIEHGVDGAVSVTQDGEALKHVQTPTENYKIRARLF